MNGYLIGSAAMNYSPWRASKQLEKQVRHCHFASPLSTPFVMSVMRVAPSSRKLAPSMVSSLYDPIFKVAREPRDY